MFKRYAAGILTVLLIFSLFSALSVGVHANSAQTYWYGETAAGVGVIGEECPIVVKNELLTFEIPELPAPQFDAVQAGTVTARYTFYNPADYSVTARLAFPFASSDRYFRAEEDDPLHSGCGASIDGQPVQTTMRFTYMNASYDNQYDLSRLVDGFKTDSFFTPETPVRTVSFTAYTANGDDAELTVDIPVGSERRCAFYGGGKDRVGDDVRIKLYIRSGETFTLTIFGEQLNEDPAYSFSDPDTRKPVSGRLERIDEDKPRTLGEIVRESNDARYGISDTDWYNAAVDSILLSEYVSGCYGTDGFDSFLSKKLLCWYEYEMTLAPGQTVINTVKAPLYPSVDKGYDPTCYDFEYLLSPAATWADFGELTVVLDTPFYLVNEQRQGPFYTFEKTDGGYRLDFDTLPKGELTFRLSTDPSPERVSRIFSDLMRIFLVFLLVCAMGAAVVWIIGAITAVVIICVKYGKRKTTERE